MSHSGDIKQSGLFNYLLLLTIFFIILETSFFITCSDVYLSDYKLVGYHLNIPQSVLPGILFFFSVQLFIHLFFTIFAWACARLSAVTLKLTWKNTEKLGYSLWFFGIITILLANQIFYPNSKFSSIVLFFMPHLLTKWILILSCIAWLIIFALTLKGLFEIFSLKITLVVLLIAVGAISYWHTQQSSLEITDGASKQKPNIIIIGFDSLRPDFLSYFGHEYATPNFDSFLNQSTVFTNAITPLARTFPSWISLLTGQYPLHNGVRTNLLNTSHLTFHQTLPSILRAQGYQTIYASDETRFSNITSQYGFDTIVTPPGGFNDFFLGTLNDFPMSNLLVNTALGKYLFPYSYANRAMFVTYQPDSFLDMVKNALNKPRKQPTFFAIHFCLTHFPYFWGSQLADKNVLLNYQAAVQKNDELLNQLLTYLKQIHLLDHSVVVLLSDHGETIELHGDRATNAELFYPGQNKEIPHFYPVSSEKETIDQSAGHGGDVLALPQNHSLLAFRFYGVNENAHQEISEMISLTAIKPTLLAWLQIKDNSSDGISLKEKIVGQHSQPTSARHIFIESDFSPEAVYSVHPEMRKVLFEGIDYFQIDPVTTRITVKKNMEEVINSSKQVADFYGEWILAFYPQNKNVMMPVLVNLKTGEWTNDLTTAFAIHSPAQQMMQALNQFYSRNDH